MCSVEAGREPGIHRDRGSPATAGWAGFSPAADKVPIHAPLSHRGSSGRPTLGNLKGVQWEASFPQCGGCEAQRSWGWWGWTQLPRASWCHDTPFCPPRSLMPQMTRLTLEGPGTDLPFNSFAPVLSSLMGQTGQPHTV